MDAFMKFLGKHTDVNIDDALSMLYHEYCESKRVAEVALNSMERPSDQRLLQHMSKVTAKASACECTQIIFTSRGTASSEISNSCPCLCRSCGRAGMRAVLLRRLPNCLRIVPEIPARKKRACTPPVGACRSGGSTPT
eukprot:2624900-Amphidinium_carterae.1